MGFLSIRGDYKDRRLAQLAEDVGDLIILAVLPPDHPDPATDGVWANIW